MPHSSHPLKRALLGMLLVGLLLGLTRTVHAAEKSYSASRFDTVVVVEEGGSLRVTETIVFDFVGGPFTFVFRELPLDYTDGITVVEASVDGVPYPIGQEAGQVEIEQDDPLRIEWHLAPTSDQRHTVELTYRVAGAVRQGEGADLLLWQPLPDDYEYPIAASQTVIEYPATTELLAAPTVEAGTATVQQAPQRVTFTSQALAPDSPLVVALRFEAGSLISAPPQWQLQQQTNAARLPYWLALAGLILFPGLLGLVALWRKHSAAIEGAGTHMQPPTDLPPAMAGALLTRGEPQWQHAQATLYELGARGVIRIEELAEKKWYRPHDFALHLVDDTRELRPHEAGLVTLLFGMPGARTSPIKLSEMGRKITGSAWKQYKEPLQAEIEARGFLSPARQSMRRRFMAGSIVLLFAGLALVVLTGILLGKPFGPGPFLAAIAPLLLGVIGMILGSSLVPLSEAGAAQAAQWQQFRNYLNEVTKGQQPVSSPALFGNYLPYVAAFGLTKPWSKQSEKAGWVEVPPYFQSLPGTPAEQLWPIWLSSQNAFTSAGGSASGSAGGAGAAGGGASGAG